jgi:hypothetical protein
MKNYWLIGMLIVLPGISWTQCTTGNPGTNCSGPQTVQPQAGNTKQSAITLVDLGLPVPAPAAAQYTISIGSGMLLESDNGNSYHSLMGAQGPQGASGATGPAGPAGAAGVQGSIGATGLAGAAGQIGPSGAAGAIGPAGVTGAQGPIGVPGLAGATGQPGASGAIGPAGPTGPAGAVGLQGQIGATGLAGAQGQLGAAGATGPQGVAGMIGAAGIQGAQGAAGPAGIQGPPGAAGVSAAPPDYSFSWTAFKAAVGINEVGGGIDRDQIDMSNATSVRLVITMATNALPIGSYAQAEYTPDGTNWFPLSAELPVITPDGTFSSTWQGMPTGANGDHVVRIVVFNAATGPAQVGLRQSHLQFK